MLSIDTLRFERSTELRKVRLMPEWCAKAFWLRPRVARSRRMFLASTSSSLPSASRKRIVPIDGFFKLQSNSDWPIVILKVGAWSE
jgi:hypothetical protein